MFKGARRDNNVSSACLVSLKRVFEEKSDGHELMSFRLVATLDHLQGLLDVQPIDQLFRNVLVSHLAQNVREIGFPNIDLKERDRFEAGMGAGRGSKTSHN